MSERASEYAYLLLFLLKRFSMYYFRRGLQLIIYMFIKPRFRNTWGERRGREREREREGEKERERERGRERGVFSLTVLKR